MCGIIISSDEIEEGCYKKVINRGPDLVNKIKYNGYNFIHCLLELTGERTPQPIIDEDIVLIFNGEIYNYKEILSDAKSDGYSIIECYKKHGQFFFKYLDGEFTIVLFDFKKDLLFIVSDIFGTKPLFYKINKDMVRITSYSSVFPNCDMKEIENNTVIIYDMKEMKIRNRNIIHKFDLNQHKNDYHDFNKALEKAVIKRYPEKDPPLLNLSSGLDSGVISCILKKYGKKAIYISFNKNEDKEVLKKRNEILNNSIIFLDLVEEEKRLYKKDLENNCEPFTWDWRYVPKINKIDNGFDKSSMLAKAKTMKMLNTTNPKIKVSYSGIGGDEVMNIAKYYSHGVGNPSRFPKNLEKVFPWKNFFEGSMKNYIKGDEYVGGCYSFETRFPFCDKYLVQEFLWLTPDLKNRFQKYDQKPALVQYLIKEKYPFCEKKYGFDV